MDRFNALGRGLQIMLVAGVLLFIDTFLNWQDFEAEGVDLGGVSAWDDIGGILLGLLTVVLVAWIAIRLAGVDFRLPFSDALVAAVLALLILVLAVVKNLEDDFSTIWAWIGMFLAIAIAIGAWLQIQASGGIDALTREMPGMGAAGTTTTASAPEPPESATVPPPSAAAEPPMAPTEPYAAPGEPETAPDEYEPPEETIQRDRPDV